MFGNYTMCGMLISMKSFVIFVIAAIIVVGGIVLFNREASAPAAGEPTTLSAPPTPPVAIEPAFPAPTLEPQPPVPQAHMVRYTDSGYAPASLEINKGDTVIFANESNDKVWTASGPHPTHTNYSEFDQKSGGLPGSRYSFTFTKAGNWRYHNHLNPAHGGTIVVK